MKNLYQVLVTVDGAILKMSAKRRCIPQKEIAPLVHLTTGAIYARLDHLREEAAENFIASKNSLPSWYYCRDGNPLTHFLQEDNRMAYRVKAYTLRGIHGKRHAGYFISFKDGQGKSHELK